MDNKKNITIPVHNEEFQLMLRTASEGDLHNLLQWKNDRREFFFHKDEISPKQQLEWFRAYQSRNNDFMFVVFVNETAIGCMGIRLIKDEWDVYNVILGLADYSGKGLMSKAFQAMLGFAVSHSQNSVVLQVLKHNPAIEWYKKNGFVITSEQTDHFCMSYHQKIPKINSMISVFGSLVGNEEIANVTACMRSQWMGFGKNVEAFEKKYMEKYGLPSFAMVDSGSNALFMAVKLLDLPPDSEVILPSFTWVSCAQAILLAGHRPVFCDVDLTTMNVRREDIEAKVTKKTAAIMVVHFAGLAVDIDPIQKLGYPIIEDAAHAVDSTYKGKPCGAIGDIGIFSYDAVKNLTVGEGGGITARLPERIERAKVMRYCGIGKSGFDSAVANAGAKTRWWEYNIQEPFIKMLPTNIAAGIGIAQLDRIDSLQARRKEIWDTYQYALADIPGLITPPEASPGDRHSYFTYCIRVPKRDELAHYLLSEQIYTTLRYHPLHLNPLYGQMDVRLTNSEQLNDDALSIPIHPRLTDEEVRKIVEKIKTFYS